MAGRAPASRARSADAARDARPFVLPRRLQQGGAAPSGEALADSVRGPRAGHSSCRRRAVYRAHRARRDERAVRLRPAGAHRPRGAGGPRRARASHRGAMRRRELRGAAGQGAGAGSRALRCTVAHLVRQAARTQGGIIMSRNPQLNEKGELQHLLTIEGLPREVLTHILDTAASFVNVAERDVKKVPLLRGKSVFNLFFEASTRTRTTFEIAAKRLSADVINLNIATSSQTKGETLLDTVDNLSAMHADMFVVRHATSGAPHLIAQHVGAHAHVINAGDGRHAHPTQGLLDSSTIRHYKRDFTQLSVAVVGDLL